MVSKPTSVLVAFSWDSFETLEEVLSGIVPSPGSILSLVGRECTVVVVPVHFALVMDNNDLQKIDRVLDCLLAEDPVNTEAWMISWA